MKDFEDAVEDAAKSKSSSKEEVADKEGGDDLVGSNLLNKLTAAIESRDASKVKDANDDSITLVFLWVVGQNELNQE